MILARGQGARQKDSDVGGPDWFKFLVQADAADRVPAVLQRGRANLVAVRPLVCAAMCARRDQPPLELGEHDAADAPPPPARREADAQHRRPRAADRGDYRTDNVGADDSDYGGRSRAHRGDQVGHAEDRQRSADRRVVPQPDRRVEVILVKVADAPRRHWPSLPAGNRQYGVLDLFEDTKVVARETGSMKDQARVLDATAV